MSYGQQHLRVACIGELEELGCFSESKCIQDTAASPAMLFHAHLLLHQGTFISELRGPDLQHKNMADDGQGALWSLQPISASEPILLPWRWVLKSLPVEGISCSLHGGPQSPSLKTVKILHPEVLCASLSTVATVTNICFCCLVLAFAFPRDWCCLHWDFSSPLHAVPIALAPFLWHLLFLPRHPPRPVDLPFCSELFCQMKTKC